jgi:hypothetical protein
VIALIPLAFPLVVDTCVLQPPIATWCAIRVEPWFCPYANKWLCCHDMYLLEGMSTWFPSKIEIHKWIEEQEKEFAEAQNNNPNIIIEDWLGRYIFTDIHEIFFVRIHQELYEWMARLEDTQFEIRSRLPVVWTSMLIKKIKRVDKPMARELDHWFDSTIGGYITEFSIDRVESYSQVERYLFNRTRRNFLHFLKLKIKMLLHEKNILKIQ